METPAQKAVKKCRKCLTVKSVDHFHKGRRYADGMYPWCKQCSYEYRNNLNKKKPECRSKETRTAEDRKEYRSARYLDRAKRLNRHKMWKGCKDCGYKKHPEALDFDHVRGTKKFGVNLNSNRTWSKMIEEMRKCEVRCANCHRIATAKRRRTS